MFCLHISTQRSSSLTYQESNLCPHSTETPFSPQTLQTPTGKMSHARVYMASSFPPYSKENEILEHPRETGDYCSPTTTSNVTHPVLLFDGLL